MNRTAGIRGIQNRWMRDRLNIGAAFLETSSHHSTSYEVAVIVGHDHEAERNASGIEKKTIGVGREVV